MIRKKTIRLFGIPGSGKTTRCLRFIQQFIDEGYKIEDICFTTYTRAGIVSIKQKLAKTNIIYDEKNNYVRTLNSLTWRLCGFNKQQQLDERGSEIKNYFKSIGVEVENEDKEDNEKLEYEHIIIIYNELLHEKAIPFDNIGGDEIKELINNYIIKTENDDLDNEMIFGVLKKFNKWKNDNNKKMYVDSFIETLYRKIDIPNLILIVDEAQDLSYVQTQLINLWTKHYTRDYFIIAGDDDQTVHEWAGAKPDFLIEYKNENMEEIILTKSYRLPLNISEFCNGILEGIEYRQEKWIESENEDGKIKVLNVINKDDFVRYFLNVFKNKECFLLSRTNKLLNRIANSMFERSDCPPFSYLNNRQGLWSKKLICISNALNKIVNKKDLLKIEAQYLLDILPSDTCLVHGAKSCYKDMKDRDVISYVEFLNKTKLWSSQRTINTFKDVSLGNIKSDIIGYIKYDKGKDNRDKIFKNDRYKLKLRDIVKIFDLDFDEEGNLVTDMNVKFGTFHASKGLEAENVFVFLGTNKFFGEINDSERRCFYVACSRSKRNLFFIPAFDDENKNLEMEFDDLIRKFQT